MVANIRGYTPNYAFKLVNFDTPRWHTHEYANWQQLDSMFFQLGTPPIRGEWLNGTIYVIGDRTFEGETGDLYRCLVQHTSAPTGTFAEDRLAHPTYWTLQVLGVPLFRGEWLPAAVYALGDIVTVGGLAYYLCTTSHTSSATFPPDAAFWQTVFDASNIVLSVDAAEDARDAALAAQAAAEEAAADAAAAAEAASSSQSAFRWNFDTNTAVSEPGIGKMRFNSATPSSITKLIVSAFSADAGNPNVGGWLITWDDSTNLSNRGSIYIRNATAPENYMVLQVNNPVLDHGTWLEIGVIEVTHGGTVNFDDLLAVAFTRTGDAGTGGSGGGDLVSDNNLSDVDDPAAAAENLGLGVTDTPTFVQVHVGTATVNDHAITKLQHDTDLSAKAPLASPAFSGNPTVPDQAALNNSTRAANTKYVDSACGVVTAAFQAADNLKAPLADPAFTGAPTAPNPAIVTNTTRLATTAYVHHGLSIAAGVDFNTLKDPGTYSCNNSDSNPNEPTGGGQWYLHVLVFGPNPTSYLVQVAYSLVNEGLVYTRRLLNNVWGSWIRVDPQDKAPIASPTFTGTPTTTAPNAGDNSLRIATTAFVQSEKPQLATYKEFQQNNAAAVNKYLSVGAAWQAAGIVAITDAEAAAGYDFNNATNPAINLYWALTGAGKTFASPNGLKNGQSGVIFLQAGATGTITTWGTKFKFPGGVKPTLTINGTDIITFTVLGDGNMYCSFVLDIR